MWLKAYSIAVFVVLLQMMFQKRIQQNKRKGLQVASKNMPPMALF